MGTYWNLCGSGAALNTIVMVGSHDAGINKGKWYAKTQEHNIYHQAYNGVRLFDLRVAAAASGQVGGTKAVEMRAYHADGVLRKDDQKTRFVQDLGRNVQLDRSKIMMGAFGDTLENILAEAKAFVEQEPQEFLILKFDKCVNYTLIAEACVTKLGNRIYDQGGNLNTKTLDDLKGRVICVFTEEGLLAIGNAYGPAQGILGILNLAAPGAAGYQAGYDGLQYYGKGGTNPFGITATTENKKKQKNLMVNGVASDPNVMGMMYWTSTGLLGNVRFRNWMMWKGSNRACLKATWGAGLEAAIDDRLNNHQNPLDAGGNLLKTFMPNIVMIDFANSDRCSLILDLNQVAAHELAQAVQFAQAQIAQAQNGP